MSNGPLGNDERKQQFVRNVQAMDPAAREARARELEGKLPRIPPGLNAVYPAVSQAAQRLQAWIVARKTNAASFPFVGAPGYAAKEISCKPKTANRNNQIAWAGDVRVVQTAGLVVDPTVCPTAFSTPARWQSALEIWKTFRREYLEPKLFGYEVNLRKGSAHFGCLMKDHLFIYGDLDLFDVIKPSTSASDSERKFSEKLEHQTNEYTVLSRIAGNLINEYVHSPVVLHGAQAHHHKYGTFGDEELQIFAPDGRAFELMSKIQARLWYATRWPGRVPAAIEGDWLLSL